MMHGGPDSDLYSRLESLSKAMESSGRIDEHEHPDAYGAILDAMRFVAAAPHPPIDPDADLAARLEQHARIHDEHVPYDSEQARWAADLRAAAEVVRGASAQPQAAGLRQEIARLRTALRFYARGEHYTLDEREEFDTVSGEPQNWLCSGLEESATMVENGTCCPVCVAGH